MGWSAPNDPLRLAWVRAAAARSDDHLLAAANKRRSELLQQARPYGAGFAGYQAHEQIGVGDTVGASAHARARSPVPSAVVPVKAKVTNFAGAWKVTGAEACQVAP